MATKKAHNLPQALAMLGPFLLFIHKLQLWTSQDIEKADLQETLKPKAWPFSHTERISLHEVEYIIQSNGSVMIYISSSNNPFRIHTEQDILEILFYLGKVEDRLRSLISDLHCRIVLPVRMWMLKGCDVNKDVMIDGVASITLPDLQVPFFDRVLRACVKPEAEGDRFFYRFEWSLTPNMPVAEALEYLMRKIKMDRETIMQSISNRR